LEKANFLYLNLLEYLNRALLYVITSSYAQS
jgi:hypothetical protein